MRRRKIPPLSTIDAPDFVKDLGFTYNMSKLELGSKSNGCSRKKSGSVYQLKSGKWKAQIQKGKVRYKLGTYATAENAMEALNRKKCELGLKEEDALRGVYQRKSGRWQTAIRHPLKKARIHLGTFGTAEEAKEVNDRKRREFDSMFPGHESCAEEVEEAYRCEFDLMFPGSKKLKRLSDSRKGDAVAEGTTCLSDDPSRLRKSTEEAEEAYNNTICEFGLMVRAHKKKASGEADATPEVKSDSTCVSGDPSGSTRVHLGTSTEEAKEPYDSKLSNYRPDSHDFGLKADAEQSQKNQRLRYVYQRKSGRWQTEIKHPLTKARIYLGTYATAEEAKEAYDSKRREFDSMFPGHYKCKESKDSCELGLKADAEQSQKNQRLKYVYPRKSGRWTTEIRHPITKATIRLGTFDTPEEAKEAYDSKRREFDSMFPSHKTKDSCDMKAGPEQSQKIQRPCCAEEAEEACNSNKREFDLMLPVNNKLKQSDAIVEVKSYSTCVSDDPYTSSDGSLVIRTGREGETRRSMLNENVQSVPMFVTEERGEFDSDVIDRYGQLVGEYSRLDDELWLCRSEDDAT